MTSSEQADGLLQTLGLSTVACTAVAVGVLGVAYGPGAVVARSHPIVFGGLMFAFGAVAATLLAVRRRSRRAGRVQHCDDTSSPVSQVEVVDDAAADTARAEAAFIASMSHELRTPLHALLGGAQALIEDGILTPRDMALVTAMTVEGERLLLLVNGSIERRQERSSPVSVESPPPLAVPGARHTGSLPCLSVDELPKEIVTQLERAAGICDFFLVTDLLGRLADHDAGLARRLRRYVDSFDYEGMTASLCRSVERRKAAARPTKSPIDVHAPEHLSATDLMFTPSSWHNE